MEKTSVISFIEFILHSLSIRYGDSVVYSAISSYLLARDKQISSLSSFTSD